VTSIDFSGDGVIASNVGSAITVTIPGGASSSVALGAVINTAQGWNLP
jgi:hypothetical protein